MTLGYDAPSSQEADDPVAGFQAARSPTVFCLLNHPILKIRGGGMPHLPQSSERQGIRLGGDAYERHQSRRQIRPVTVDNMFEPAQCS